MQYVRDVNVDTHLRTSKPLYIDILGILTLALRFGAYSEKPRDPEFSPSIFRTSVLDGLKIKVFGIQKVVSHDVYNHVVRQVRSQSL